jgi:amino acid permease
MNEESQENGTLGLWSTVFAIMSTIIGGGMLSLPWAFYQSGIYFAIVFSILASI